MTIGKTLYITDVAFFIGAEAQADRNSNQIGLVEILNYTDTMPLLFLGGNGGGGIPLAKPIKVASGKVMWFTAYNYANHAVRMNISVKGYEI